MTPETQKKLIVGGIITAVIGIGGYLGYKYFTKPTGADPLSNPSNGTSNSGTTISPAIVFDAKKFSNLLYEAMNRAGTDEDTILEVLTNVTTEKQFQQVSDAFGLKGYCDSLGYNCYFPFLYNATKRPLKYWLKQELSEEEYNTLKYKFKNVL